MVTFIGLKGKETSSYLFAFIVMHVVPFPLMVLLIFGVLRRVANMVFFRCSIKESLFSLALYS